MLFESKGVFVPDEAAHDTESLLVALRKKFGEHDGRKRGAAQLGRWLGEIANGAVKLIGQEWTLAELVYPVVVAYDVRTDRPGHAEFLGKEFAAALAPDERMRNGYMRKGRFSVAPLIIMTITDVEALESSVNNFRLVDFLRDYAQSGHDGIRESVHDYWAFNVRKYPLSMTKIAIRAEALLEEVRQQMFPHIQMPSVEPGA